MRVLYVGAHSDDFEMMAAGTFIKYANQGHDVFVAIATNGNIGSHVHETKEEVAKIRYEEAKASCDIIGAKLIWMGYDDEYLIDSRETRDSFIDAVREADPDVIFTQPRGSDFIPDHEMTGFLTYHARVVATVPLIKTAHAAKQTIVPMFYTPPSGFKDFQPNYYVDISDVFDKKMEMWKCHKSQQSEWLAETYNTSFTDALTTAGKFFADQTGAGVRYAEAFLLCNTYPIGAPEPHKLLP